MFEVSVKFDRNLIISENFRPSGGGGKRGTPLRRGGGSYYTNKDVAMVFKDIKAILIPEFPIITKFLDKTRI